MPTEPDLSGLDALIDRVGAERQRLIALLLAIQERYCHLPPAALQRVAERLGCGEAEVTGVATFYGQFRLRPVGAHRIRVCDGTACHVKRADTLLDALLRHLKIEPPGDTDAAGRFTVETVACLGCCTLAPVIQIDDTTYGHLSPEQIPRMLEGFLEAAAVRRAARSSPASSATEGAVEIRIGLGSCCVAKGSRELFAALDAAARQAGAGRVRIKRVGCIGACYQAPVVEVLAPGREPARYVGLQPADAGELIARHAPASGVGMHLRAWGDRWLDRLFTGTAGAVADHQVDAGRAETAAFLARQVRLATDGAGARDPLDLDEYRRNGGFGALRRLVESDGLEEKRREALIDVLARSGLRGRGGAGFPTGRKWAAVRAAPGAAKVAVCNGDEGDPGAFMDRMILESHPYRVIEGLAVAAWAVGAREAIFYIRHEYPLAVQRVRAALARAVEAGMLDGLAPDGGRLPMRVAEGAGAFVCGEETALLASLEGRRGMPHPRPPYPAQRGLNGWPTLVNNVETLAFVPWILAHGPEAFATLGAGGSRGTKVFALAGRVVRGGLIEVPMGMSLHDIVMEIGGGVGEGRTFKAVQVGGPSGGCIPASLAATPVDYEALRAVGGMMGSGGLVVLDDSDCMVEMARYFLAFTQRESCGQCTACRVGTRRMLEILERLCAGQGRGADVAELERLALEVRGGSLCGLGRTAPNPVLSTLRHFRGEYEAHVAGRCPAGRCRALIHYTVSTRCIGCTRCAQACPVEAIPFTPHARAVIDQEKCTRCNTCRTVCPAGAIEVQ